MGALKHMLQKRGFAGFHLKYLQSLFMKNIISNLSKINHYRGCYNNYSTYNKRLLPVCMLRNDAVGISSAVTDQGGLNSGWVAYQIGYFGNGILAGLS